MTRTRTAPGRGRDVPRPGAHDPADEPITGPPSGAAHVTGRPGAPRAPSATAGRGLGREHAAPRRPRALPPVRRRSGASAGVRCERGPAQREGATAAPPAPVLHRRDRGRRRPGRHRALRRRAQHRRRGQRLPRPTPKTPARTARCATASASRWSSGSTGSSRPAPPPHRRPGPSRSATRTPPCGSTSASRPAPTRPGRVAAAARRADRVRRGTGSAGQVAYPGVLRRAARAGRPDRHRPAGPIGPRRPAPDRSGGWPRRTSEQGVTNRG